MVTVQHAELEGKGFREAWDDPHVVTGSGGNVFVIATSVDSGANWLAVADYICDGTADNVEIAAAIAALPALGGRIIQAPGTYQIAADISITANARIEMQCTGAVWKLATGVAGLTVSQGVVAAKGVRIIGLSVDGQSNASTTGIRLRDTNNAELISPVIENCAVGLNLDSNAATKFVEGTLVDNPLLRDNTVGYDFTVVSGTGSFAQTVIRGSRCVVGTGGTGLRATATTAILQRCFIQGTFWIDSNETAVNLDCNIEDSTFTLAVEGAGGSTGNIALAVGANATNTDQAFISLLLTGTIATQLSTTRNLTYWSGGSQMVWSAGTQVMGIKRHGDTTDRLRFDGPTAGGRIQFGNGTTLDIDLLRSAANVLTTNDKFDPASLSLQTKAGTPVDGDITGGAADGDIVLDTTGNKIWVRIGATWKGVVVA